MPQESESVIDQRGPEEKKNLTNLQEFRMFLGFGLFKSNYIFNGRKRSGKKREMCKTPFSMMENILL